MVDVIGGLPHLSPGDFRSVQEIGRLLPGDDAVVVWPRAPLTRTSTALPRR